MLASLPPKSMSTKDDGSSSGEDDCERFLDLLLGGDRCLMSWMDVSKTDRYWMAEAHVDFLHADCVKKLAEKLVCVLLPEIKVLVVLFPHRGEEISAKCSAKPEWMVTNAPGTEVLLFVIVLYIPGGPQYRDELVANWESVCPWVIVEAVCEHGRTAGRDGEREGHGLKVYYELQVFGCDQLARRWSGCE